MNVKKAVLALRSLGLRKVSSILLYTRLRDRLDRGYRQEMPYGEPAQPGRLQSAEPFESGARFRFERADLEVRFLAHDLARLSWEPGLAPVPYSLAKTEWVEPTVDFSRSKAGRCLTSEELEVEVRDQGEVLFRAPGGSTLRADLPPERWGESGSQRTSWNLRTHMADDERIYGLGERAAPLNRRGGSYLMWNSDPGGSYGPGKDPLYICIPAYLSLHDRGSCLVFYENPFKAVFDIGLPSGQEAALDAHFEDGMLRYYFIPGPPARALERFTELTGRAGLPPRWALGYHQCRWGYKNEADVLQVLAGFKENDMPLSALHLDIDYMDGFRVFTVDKERFPDLAALAQTFAERDVKLVTILDPGVKVDPSYEVYRSGTRNKAFCKLPNGKPVIGQVWPGRSVFPDFSSPEVREWWGDHYAFLLDQGVAGIWHDMNEPTSFTSWGDMTLPLETRHEMEGRSGDHRQGHNLYGLLMNRAGHDALRRLRPENRPWIITRSGWAGVQRYAWNWTGDTETSWGALRMTIPTVLGLGLTGLPFSGPDVGGFSGTPTAEQYVRWFQLAAFLPYFRTHSAIGLPPREPWVYGEPYTSILRDILKLRYSLAPYIYTLAWEAARTGNPPVRPLFWLDPGEKDLWDVEDAFLLGDCLLVAPVVEAGCLEREVRLPVGGWYDFWSGRLVEGNGQVKLEAPLECIPLLARAGSILPLEEDGKLLLHVYPDGEGRAGGLLYSDAGDGYGPSRLDRFTLAPTLAGPELSREEEGVYPFPYTEIVIQIHGQGEKRIETGVFERLLVE